MLVTEAGGTRRPSISTSVRVEPTLRRLSCAALPLPPPTPPVAEGLLTWLRVPENTGRMVSDSVRLVGRTLSSISLADDRDRVRAVVAVLDRARSGDDNRIVARRFSGGGLGLGPGSHRSAAQRYAGQKLNQCTPLGHDISPLSVCSRPGAQRAPANPPLTQTRAEPGCNIETGAVAIRSLEPGLARFALARIAARRQPVRRAPAPVHPSGRVTGPHRDDQHGRGSAEGTHCARGLATSRRAS